MMIVMRAFIDDVHFYSPFRYRTIQKQKQKQKIRVTIKMEELAKNVREGGSKDYDICGTKFLLTWRSHLDKDILKTWLAGEFGNIREIYICWENADDDFNYEHTHCAVCFEKRVLRKEKNTFNVWHHKSDDGTNDNIQSTFKNIKPSKDDWNKVCCYVSKSDPSLKEFHDKLLAMTPRKESIRLLIRRRVNGVMRTHQQDMKPNRKSRKRLKENIERMVNYKFRNIFGNKERNTTNNDVKRRKIWNN